MQSRPKIGLRAFGAQAVAWHLDFSQQKPKIVKSCKSFQKTSQKWNRYQKLQKNGKSCKKMANVAKRCQKIPKVAPKKSKAVKSSKNIWHLMTFAIKWHKKSWKMPYFRKVALMLLMASQCWCSDTANASDAIDALMLLMGWCCWYADAADAVMLLIRL